LWSVIPREPERTQKIFRYRMRARSRNEISPRQQPFCEARAFACIPTSVVEKRPAATENLR